VWFPMLPIRCAASFWGTSISVATGAMLLGAMAGLEIPAACSVWLGLILVSLQIGLNLAVPLPFSPIALGPAGAIDGIVWG
jgi:hypothetical protein